MTISIAWLKGVGIGDGLACFGIPYFYRNPHSIITLGKNCSIRSSFRSNNIGSMCRTRICTQGPAASIVIGDNVGMSSATITAHQSITIGSDTMIGAGCVIVDSDWHSLSFNPIERHTQEGKTKPVVIGRNVFISTRCIILKGVHIGDNAIIGAGSVVTHDIPANAKAAGNPCRIL